MNSQATLEQDPSQTQLTDGFTQGLLENIQTQAVVNEQLVGRLLALELRMAQLERTAYAERLEEISRRTASLWEIFQQIVATGLPSPAAASAAQVPSSGPLLSCLCTEAQMRSDWVAEWLERMGMQFQLHRKLWELCYIPQALRERGMLAPGRRGLGFAVGTEPLPALFAGLGCQVVATDQERAAAEATGWAASNQHAESLASLQRPAICAPEQFGRQVSFRNVDMNDIPADLRRGEFDFLWSCCSFEHLGSIEQGLRFVRNAMECLRPGGIAVHTTEFNLSSDSDTVDHTGTVLFRRQDIERLTGELRALGDSIELNFDAGSGFADHYVDLPPYKQDIHLRLRIARYTATSIGLIIQKHG